ncbi:hypothetical protein KR026_008749, partial [Drosophila bipectinata]
SSSSAFYVHFQDPVKDRPPVDLQLKNRRPSPRHLARRQAAAAERRSALEDLKVQELSVRLAKVALLTDRHHRHTTQTWLEARDRISRDMDAHVRRRTTQISKRLKNLVEHNDEVKARKEEARQERFLRKLAHLYEVKTMSTISQFWGKL